jgi:hypothetical protein
VSYRAGTSGLGKHGIADSEPRIICDNCGHVLPVSKPSGQPYRWFLDRYLDGKPAPRWSGKRNADGTRTDYCPTCRDVYGCEIAP